MKPLNTNDGWEDIVNANAKTRNRAKIRRMTKKLWLIVIMLAVIFVNLMLWLLNVIPAVPSLWVTGICGAVAAFAAGQVFEACNK